MDKACELPLVGTVFFGVLGSSASSPSSEATVAIEEGVEEATDEKAEKAADGVSMGIVASEWC